MLGRVVLIAMVCARVAAKPLPSFTKSPTPENQCLNVRGAGAPAVDGIYRRSTYGQSLFFSRYWYVKVDCLPHQDIVDSHAGSSEKGSNACMQLVWDCDIHGWQFFNGYYYYASSSNQNKPAAPTDSWVLEDSGVSPPPVLRYIECPHTALTEIYADAQNEHATDFQVEQKQKLALIASGSCAFLAIGIVVAVLKSRRLAEPSSNDLAYQNLVA